MNTIITPIHTDAMNPNRSDGRTLDRRRRTARQAERRFLKRHGGLGARTLYRIASAIA